MKGQGTCTCTHAANKQEKESGDFHTSSYGTVLKKKKIISFEFVQRHLDFDILQPESTTSSTDKWFKENKKKKYGAIERS